MQLTFILVGVSAEEAELDETEKLTKVKDRPKLSTWVQSESIFRLLDPHLLVFYSPLKSKGDVCLVV